MVETIDRTEVRVIDLGSEFGSLDETELTRLRFFLRKLAHVDPARGILLDFSNLRYFGAGFLGILAEAASALRSQGRMVALCGLNVMQQSMLHDTGLHRRFAVFPTRLRALNMLGRFGSTAIRATPC